MAYNLIVTDRFEELLDERLNYLLFKFKNEPAAKHLLDGIDSLYDRMEDNPYQFADCRDPFLKSKGYKESVIMDMDYILIFRIEVDTVYILGIFHQLENYKEKL
ncbi:type II toxin-antitoxin system RelE/ParE family toxin [Muricomes intestini]|jgi:plasmid stabilization system protein ParE|uniref:type II toxin-antitoxin system RelE/ParE family toxin n=1 Tax=Muricomes intestini TaxID=1796634 RepID=UPI000E9D13E5|nr:type II toxin-antitoxin system RelE/ParE family toxin [Lachnospiraceae bacterium]HCR83017.1 type II toxin-antitoxin system RelE/ParE family toxin [Lachnospiraceae bacterium]